MQIISFYFQRLYDALVEGGWRLMPDRCFINSLFVVETHMWTRSVFLIKFITAVWLVSNDNITLTIQWQFSFPQIKYLRLKTYRCKTVQLSSNSQHLDSGTTVGIWIMNLSCIQVLGICLVVKWSISQTMISIADWNVPCSDAIWMMRLLSGTWKANTKLSTMCMVVIQMSGIQIPTVHI